MTNSDDTSEPPTPKAGYATPVKPSKSSSTASHPNPPSTDVSPRVDTNISNSGASTKKKHEEFKNQLVHDVFGRDNKGRVPMEKVTMLIWQFRNDPAVVNFMAQFVAKVRCLFGSLLLLRNSALLSCSFLLFGQP